MAQRKPLPAPMTLKLEEPERLQPKTRAGRALYTGLCDVARKSRSDAAKVRACELLGILEGLWTVKELKSLEAPPVSVPKIQPEANDRVLQELKTQENPKLAPFLPETGDQLVDLAAKYGLKK